MTSKSLCLREPPLLVNHQIKGDRLLTITFSLHNCLGKAPLISTPRIKIIRKMVISALSKWGQSESNRLKLTPLIRQQLVILNMKKLKHKRQQLNKKISLTLMSVLLWIIYFPMFTENLCWNMIRLPNNLRKKAKSTISRQTLTTGCLWRTKSKNRPIKLTIGSQ